MKKLGIKLGNGNGTTHEWTDQEMIDVFTNNPQSAMEYENVLLTLMEERERVQKEIQDMQKRRVKGVGPVIEHLNFLSRILFFRILELRRWTENPKIDVKASKTSVDASGAIPLINYSIEDLRARYGVGSVQGMTQWLRNNLDKINAQSPELVQKNGKYWIIPAEALPIIDSMRHRKPER